MVDAGGVHKAVGLPRGEAALQARGSAGCAVPARRSCARSEQATPQRTGAGVSPPANRGRCVFQRL